MNLILYEVNKDNYKNYVELLDINEFTSEPTEKYVKTELPTLNQSIVNTYMPTINNISNNNSNNSNITSNNDNKNIIIIVVTTISSFIIIVIVIIYLKYITYQKNKIKREKEKEIIFDENFGTRYDELFDF
jgi:ATP-dependent Zn protease